MTLQISNFIIGLILIGVVVTGLAVFMSGLQAEYGVSYDNSTMDAYQNLDEIYNITEDVKDASEDQDVKETSDILGGFFSQAYKTMRITWKSISTFNKMTDASFENANVGNNTFSRTLRLAIISIVIIAIIIGVIVSAMVKRDL